MRTSKTGYFPSLDGLRFVCCTAVVAAHAFVATPLAAIGDNLGRLGVDAFFCLSGFLITKLLLEEVQAVGAINLFDFYMRRALRIWPVYFIALVGFAIPFVLGGRLNSVFGYTPNDQLLTRALPAHLLFLANWSRTPVPTPLQVLWSISVEEQFYLLFPGLLALVSRLGAKRWPVASVCVPILLVVWLVRLFTAFPAPPLGELRSTWVVSDFLLSGALAAQFVHGRESRAEAWLESARRWLEPTLAIAVGALLVMRPFDAEAPWVRWAWVFYNPVVAMLLTGAIVTLAYSSGVRGFARPLSTKLIIGLGQLTYAAYVFHIYSVAIGWAIASRLTASNSITAALLRFVIAMPLTFATALASKHLVEKRFAALKGRFARPRSEPAALEPAGPPAPHPQP